VSKGCAQIIFFIFLAIHTNEYQVVPRGEDRGAERPEEGRRRRERETEKRDTPEFN
jgi:hypothetical protein